MTVILSYGVALFVASWLGGRLPRRYQFTHADAVGDESGRRSRSALPDFT